MIVRHPNIINRNNNENKAITIGCGHSSHQNDMNFAPNQSIFGRRQTHTNAVLL